MQQSLRLATFETTQDAVPFQYYKQMFKLSTSVDIIVLKRPRNKHTLINIDNADAQNDIILSYITSSNHIL